jgi:hypothetical protein
MEQATGVNGGNNEAHLSADIDCAIFGDACLHKMEDLI